MDNIVWGDTRDLNNLFSTFAFNASSSSDGIYYASGDDEKGNELFNMLIAGRCRRNNAEEAASKLIGVILS
jgi:hypothetical protein